MKEFDLSLDNEAFTEFKKDFSRVLNSTIYNMEEKRGYSAEITVKMKVSLSKSTLPDSQALVYETEREAILPKFEHKVTSMIQIKDSCEGFMQGKYELVWDTEERKYRLRLIEDGQTSLLDDENIRYTTLVTPDGLVQDVIFQDSQQLPTLPGPDSDGPA